MGQPQQARLAAAAGRVEQGADGLPAKRLADSRGGGQDHRNPCLRGDCGRLDLRLHAAGADAGRARLPDRSGSRSAAPRTSVTIVVPGLRGSPSYRPSTSDSRTQQVGVHEMAGQRRQPVVVAEADLGGRDRVVLVHDRYDAQLEQPRKSPIGVAIVASPRDVVDRQQHLPDPQTVRGKGVAVAGHQQSLTDRSSGLLRRQVTRPGPQPHRGQAGGDRAGRDEHDLGALDPARRDARRRAGGAVRGRSCRAGSATTSRPSRRSGGLGDLQRLRDRP